MKIAVQMDPVENINIERDTTFVLMLEAQERGFDIFYYNPKNISLENERLTAQAQRLKLRRAKGEHYALGHAQTVDLAEMDVLLMRQDPPFDMDYLASTYLLEHIRQDVLIVNDPAGVRNTPEKLIVHRFADLMPPTLVTQDAGRIEAFREEHGTVILKPLFEGAGRGIRKIEKGAPFNWPDEAVIVQRFIPEISEGDKRIILINGEPVGAVSRMLAAGEVRANFAAGGTAKKAEVTAREKEICARLAPYLKEQGLFFVGIDVIGDYLTEVNVTSPTGMQQINALDNVKLESLFWDAIPGLLR